MQKEYYELRIIPKDYYKEFCDLLFDFGVEAIEERDGAIILRSEEDLKYIQEGVNSFAKELEKVSGRKIEVFTSLEKKANEDWIERYKSSITPVKVGSFYIHPTWESDKEGYINISLDPALSFGTGHHETTSSCLELLEKVVKKNSLLLDVGCGSGILSIAAYKLGAKVDLCDSDELSIKSAEENFKLNGASYQKIWVGSANQADKEYDVVVANIVADVLIIISKDLKNSLKKEGSLVLSGILEKYLDNVLSKFQEFEIKDKIKKGEWITLLLQRK